MQREGLNALAQYSEQELPATNDFATRADMAYLSSRVDALVLSSAMAGASAGTTLSQMTTLPPPSLHPPLIVGGLPPPGPRVSARSIPVSAGWRSPPADARLPPLSMKFFFAPKGET